MLKRYVGMLTLAGLLLVGVLTGAAGAVEGGGELHDYEEIRQEVSDVGAEYLPDEYEIPGFFRWFIIPLVALGVVVTGAILVGYLINQPRFEKEAEERSRR